METALKNYIKTMFAMATTPTWDSGYDGIIFYDQSAHKWITGDNEGWQIIDRNTTYLANEIFSLLWIDPFEYPNDSIIRNNYIASTSGIQLYSENNLTTYGDYALKCIAAISGSKDEYITKVLDPAVNLTDKDTINFDIRSSRVGTNLQYSIATVVGWLDDWAQRKKIIIDNTKVDSDMTHFPVPIVLGTSVGQSSQDVSDIFDTLVYPYRPTSVDDDFTGTDGVLPNPDSWNIYHDSKDSGDFSGVISIQNNELDFSITTAVTLPVVQSNFKLSGDFNIQVDFGIDSIPDDEWAVGITMGTEIDDIYGGSSYAQIARYYESVGNYLAATSNESYVTGGSSDLSGKFQLIRTGSSLVMNYWNGSSWTTLLTDAIYGTADVYVKLYARVWNVAKTLNCNFDNFVVNSGTIEWNSLEDHFTGTNDDPPNPDLWNSPTVSASNTIEIQSNTIEYNIISSIDYIYTQSKFSLSGDFDVQVGFEISVESTTGVWLFGFVMFNSDVSEIIGMDLRYNTSKVYEGSTTTGGSALFDDSATVTDTSGKVRITRTSGTVNCYYWNGSSWTLLHTRSGMTDDLVVRLKNQTTVSQTFSGTFDNFVVNSGTIKWLENTNPNRKKIAITKDDGTTQIFGEIELWDSINENAVIWVSKHDLIIDDAATTYLYLYYDSAQDGNNNYISNTNEKNTITNITGDNFTGANDDPPNPDLWRLNVDIWQGSDLSSTLPKIQSNKIELSSTVASKRSTVCSIFKLSGNFDVQVDFDDPTTIDSMLLFWENLNTVDNLGYMRINESNFEANTYLSSSWGTAQLTSRTNTYGTFGLVRTGSSIVFRYKDGTGTWNTLLTRTCVSTDLHICFQTVFNSATLANFDNFVITSGIVKYIPAQRVWDDYFKSVFHMAQDPNGDAAGAILDSTRNLNHGTPDGSMTSSDLVDGPIGKAIDMDGLDDNINIQEGDSLKISTNLTLSALVKSTDLTTNTAARIFDFSDTDGGLQYGYRLLWSQASATFRALVGDGSSLGLNSLKSFSIDTYYWITMTYDGSTLKLYIDEFSPDTVAGTKTLAYTGVSDATIGNYRQDATTVYHWEGPIAEIQISDTTRSAAWIKATNYSLKDDLLTFGTTEEPGQTITSDIHINSLNTYQTEVIDIGDMGDIYLSIKFKILNDDIENTFYVDNMYADTFSNYWIDSYEYPNDTSLRNSYTTTNSGTLQIYSEDTIVSYGSYALKGTAVSGSEDESIIRIVDPVINLTNKDRLRFDMRSSRVGTTTQLTLNDVHSGFLDTFSNKIKIIIDSTDIDSDLTHFPVPIVLGTSVGQSSQDTSAIFDELTYPQYPSSVDDDFTGTDSDPPNPDLWRDVTTNHATTSFSADIQSNKLKESFTGLNAAGSDSVTISSIFQISGDFDIQINFDSLIHQNHTAAGYSIQVTQENGYHSLVKAQYNSGNKWLLRTNDGSSSEVSPARTNDYGEMRIVRSGSSISLYTTDGLGSETLAHSGTMGSDDVYISLEGYDWESGTEISVNFDNFLINSGTIVWNPLEDHFTGTNGDAPNTDLWEDASLSTSQYTPVINSNKLRLQVGSVAADAYSRAKSIYSIAAADFSIQCDFSLVSGWGVASGGQFYLQVSEPSRSGYWAKIALNLENKTLIAEAYENSVQTEYQTQTNSVDTGSLRIRRVGTTYYMEYDIGGGWQTLGTESFDVANEVIIYLMFQNWTTYPAAITDVDNFIITSGTVTWPNNTHPSRKKIAITKSDKVTQIYGEIEYWDSANEKAVIWVSKHDLVLSSSEDTELYFYYDSNQSNNNYYIGNTNEENTITNITGDDFTGTSGDPPNPDLWAIKTVGVGEAPEIATNKLNCVIPSGGSSNAQSGGISKPTISGDFDIQIDWDSSVPSTDSVGIFLRVTTTDGKYFYVLRQRTASVHRYNTLTFDGATWIEEGAVTTTDNAGKFRLTRVGSTLRGYYWGGSSWTELGSGGFNYTSTADGVIDFQVNNSDNYPAVICNFDNFVINSGTVKYIPARRVWDNYFKSVYHMAQDPSGGSDCILDSTVSVNHGTPGGSMTSTDLADGLIGKAIDFDGTDDYINLPNMGSFKTVETLIYENTLDTTFDFFFGHDNFRLFRAPSDDATNPNKIVLSDSLASNVYSTNAISDTTWYSLVGVNNGVNKILYLDGVYQAQDSPDTVASNVVDIARWTSDTHYSNCKMAEIRISDIDRNNAWLKTTNHSLKDNLVTFDLDPATTARITHNVDINNIDVYQTEVINITSVSGTIDTVEFKILNDNLDNTFYIDKMYLS